ncbi:hypothetical protein FQZ97_1046880 [compost metagenome]
MAQHLGRFLLQGEDAPGIAQQLFAFGRGHHLALAAVQQATAEAFLQPAQLLADGGLGQVQAFGGAGEVAAVGHRHEAAQEEGIEHESIPDSTDRHGYI